MVKVKITKEQAAFLRKVIRGAKPGKASLEKALKSNAASKKALAAKAVATLRAQTTARAKLVEKQEKTRLANVKKMRGDAKAKKKKAKQIREYSDKTKLAIKNANIQVAQNVTKFMNSQPQAKVGAMYRELEDSIERKKRAQQAKSLVRVSFIGGRKD